ncbi:MAG TPA: hypothetical protein VHE34_08725 [Puia sp.]|uniref:hypothetical protein n=1 Tax=Puia sp. TaxID=2045100 RepID=UPI002B575F1E|nr:hypothetical protein [Puia sp.]HVU95294.1 hypothetical protein [Puia sp.]
MVERPGLPCGCWADGSSVARIAVNDPGVYWVTVTDANKCTATDTVFVKGTTCLVGLFAPTAFSPDGNGHIDVLWPMPYGRV